ncbi:sulfite exporter TauE/SafE family protein [Anaerovorax odorimutans]|uniref:sulfite exporter TauE/SafE family protein n=1 Tax=Anaerovorax odorimutans TaxID=109327 RepID=UPI000407EB55|nr:sulfite exporter TauE/SafE family protein [Anaerovorax odorimutans]
MDINFISIVIIGFMAQMIDGSLGMAYGVSSTTFLTTIGISPKIASASVHTAEVFTTLVSGISHWKMKNIDWTIFKKLVFPGVIGGALGAYILTSFPGDMISPIVNIYLLVMGIVVLIRGIHGISRKLIKGKQLVLVGLIGGFFDAVGGGGWGPIVTSTMVASGHPPRYTIGSVNTAEFFVTIVQALTFTLFLGIGEYWKYIAGLAIGGVLAAPLAAYVCKKMPTKNLLIIVGILIIILNLRSIILLIV